MSDSLKAELKALKDKVANKFEADRLANNERRKKKR